MSVREADWTVAAVADATNAHRLNGLDGYRAARQWVESLRQSDADAADHPEKVNVIVVVDTLGATFELDEILYELKDFAVTLVLDRAGYLFSYIKRFSDRPECVLPDRADMTDSTHCLRSYARQVVDTGEKRGAAVPERPAEGIGLTFTGDERVVAADLLQVPRGRITERGVRESIRLVLRYVAALIEGRDVVHPGDNGEAELARAQLWQWVHHETGVLDTGQIITAALVSEWLNDECAKLVAAANEPAAAAVEAAARYLEAVTLAGELAPAIVAEAYRLAD